MKFRKCLHENILKTMVNLRRYLTRFSFLENYGEYLKELNYHEDNGEFMEIFE